MQAMQEAIRKAKALIEAMPYIRAFRDKIVVVKLGGAAMEDPATMGCVLDDVVFLEAVGVKPIVVHGGGPAISREMKRRKIEPKFVLGQRVTDEATMEIVREVLVNRINAEILRTLEDLGGHGAPFADPDRGALRARRRIVRREKPDGSVEEFDMGLVGDMESIDADMFRQTLASRAVPVVAPIARGPDGEALNVNADIAASFVAGELRAEKAVFLTDTHGIRTDPEDPDSHASTLTLTHIDDLVRTGVISGGMLPKVDACRAALAKGVRKAHIIDGRLQHALLLEIFTDEGVGTQIVQ